MDPRHLWSKEYAGKGIPSSYETDPSLTARLFLAFLEDHQIQTGRLLDIGCGLGRNSFFFAEHDFHVSAIDFAATNIAWLQQEVQRLELSIEPSSVDVGQDHWPFQDRYFRLAIDVFCFKHLIEPASIQHYKQQLRRVLKSEGLFLLSLASTEDGFYGPLLKHSPDPERHLVVDPVNRIPSLLYTRDQVEKEFSSHFTLEAFVETRGTSPMHGRDYSRHLLTFIFGSQK